MNPTALASSSAGMEMRIDNGADREPTAAGSGHCFLTPVGRTDEPVPIPPPRGSRLAVLSLPRYGVSLNRFVKSPPCVRFWILWRNSSRRLVA